MALPLDVDRLPTVPRRWRSVPAEFGSTVAESGADIAARARRAIDHVELPDLSDVSVPDVTVVTGALPSTDEVADTASDAARAVVEAALVGGRAAASASRVGGRAAVRAGGVIHRQVRRHPWAAVGVTAVIVALITYLLTSSRDDASQSDPRNLSAVA